jgi:hypothetical protein
VGWNDVSSIFSTFFALNFNGSDGTHRVQSGCLAMSTKTGTWLIAQAAINPFSIETAFHGDSTKGATKIVGQRRFETLGNAAITDRGRGRPPDLRA